MQYFRNTSFATAVKPSADEKLLCRDSVFKSLLLLCPLEYIKMFKESGCFCIFSYINERNRKKNIVEAEKAIVVSSLMRLAGHKENSIA